MKQKKLWIILGIVLVAVFTFIFVVMFRNPFLTLELNGKKTVTVEVNEDYKDAGAKAIYFGKDIRNEIKEQKVKIDQIGTYQWKYEIKKWMTKKTVTRTIKVVDRKSPELKLKGREKIELTVGSSYVEPGYTVTDNYDKDLESKVKIEGNVDTSKVGEYKVVYSISDKSGNQTTVERLVHVIEKKITQPQIPKDDKEGTGGYQNIVMGPKYIKGILIVNKQYAIPSTFGGGVDATASRALKELQAGAQAAGFAMPLLSGYRSYQKQTILYQNYVKRDGQALADTYSARPGHSEHQTGLAFDIGSIDDNYGLMPAGKWLAQNCAEYGFILRYPKGKEYITGYQYEPWHIRYVGKTVAKEIMSRGITLEEYLGVA